MAFIICQPEQEDYLSEQVEHGEAYLLSWHPHPKHALKFDSIDEAKQIAQRICDHKKYRLLICELRETETQIGVKEVHEVIPASDPHLN